MDDHGSKHQEPTGANHLPMYREIILADNHHWNVGPETSGSTLKDFPKK
jgi:hypothetical protein